MAAMIAMYCAAGHPHSSAGRLAGHTAIDSRSAAAQEGKTSAGVQLCPQCQRLLNYSEGRLERCPFRQDKPTCRVCPIHCYAPSQRQQAKAVMRYAGPRMLLRHPILAVGHLGDEVRSALRRPSRR